jgi:hypothetical protein
MTILTDAQRAAYERDGFIVVPDVFSAAEIAELGAATDAFERDAALVAANDDIYDLEDTHSATAPRVRSMPAPAGIRGSWRSCRISGAASVSTPASSI